MTIWTRAAKFLGCKIVTVPSMCLDVLGQSIHDRALDEHPAGRAHLPEVVNRRAGMTWRPAPGRLFPATVLASADETIFDAAAPRFPSAAPT